MPHKKGIVTSTVRSHERISLGLSQADQSSKRSTIVAPRVVCFLPDKARIVRHGHGFSGTEQRIVFYHDDSRRDHINGLPHPVVYAIDIHT